MLGGPLDVFLKFEFQNDRWRNLGAVGGRSSPFPIDKVDHLYNSFVATTQAVMKTDDVSVCCVSGWTCVWTCGHWWVKLGQRRLRLVHWKQSASLAAASCGVSSQWDDRRLTLQTMTVTTTLHCCHWWRVAYFYCPCRQVLQSVAHRR